MRLFVHKLFHWEYWPTHVLYVPVYFQWIWYSIKARSLFFFSASNPGIKNGGFFMESKKQIYDLAPHLFPKTELVHACSSLNIMRQKIVGSGISFPMIAKPDIGQRGTAVKKIESLDDLLRYSGKSEFDFLIQQLIAYENEVGIFYVRYPDEAQGRITGIVSKEFLTVTGDGTSSVEMLMRKDPRHAMQIAKLSKQLGKGLDEIPATAEKRTLVPYGNHVRGCKFLDSSHLITTRLTTVIDAVCKQIPGFYFGRLDIMFDNWHDFENGQKFSIVEVNGASSEPTHMYDPRHSIFFAWKELTRHIRYMYAISEMNHTRGIPYLSHKQGVAEFRAYRDHNTKFNHF